MVSLATALPSRRLLGGDGVYSYRQTEEGIGTLYLCYFLPSSHIIQMTIFQFTVPVFALISSPKLPTGVVLLGTLASI